MFQSFNELDAKKCINSPKKEKKNAKSHFKKSESVFDCFFLLSSRLYFWSVGRAYSFIKMCTSFDFCLFYSVILLLEMTRSSIMNSFSSFASFFRIFHRFAYCRLLFQSSTNYSTEEMCKIPLWITKLLSNYKRILMLSDQHINVKHIN